VSPAFNLPYYGNPWTAPLLDTGTEVDTIVGGDGSDRIFAGYGDNVDGGAGGSYGDYLYISFQGAPSGVTVDFRLATQVIGGGTITDIENISWVEGSNFDDDINVASNTNNGYSNFTAVFGLGGDDHLVAGYYTGTLFGGDGDDVVDGRGSQYLQSVDGGAGNDTLYTNSNTFASAYGGDGDDLIYAHGLVHGDAGNDHIVMQVTYYQGQVFADAGDDIIEASSVGNFMVGGAGADTINGAGGADTLISGDLTGPSSSTAADDMGLDHDVLSGGGGNDVFAAGLGDDVDGGAGNDTLSLSLGGSLSGVTFSTAGLVSGAPTTVFGAAISNIETLAYLRGTEFADTLTLATQTTLLTVDAGAGDDVVTSSNSSVSLSGGAGADRFTSGLAGDIFDGGAGIDTVDYGLYATGVTVNLSTGVGAGGDQLTNVENVDGAAQADALTGNSGANVLRGLAGNDTLDGQFGADTMIGGLGDDTYVVSDLTDQVVEADSEGTDLVLSSVNYTLPANVENLTLQGAVNGVGNALANVITGGPGANVLDGAGGNDNLVGGDGDVLIGGAGADVLDGIAGVVSASYVGNSTAITADLVSQVVTGGDADGDTLYSIEGIIGTDFGDSITGNSVGNNLIGGAGNDNIDGLAGADLILGQDGADTLQGGAGNDTLSGGDGDDVIWGGADDDQLQGDNGNDLLRGGAGADVLSGGNGADTASYDQDGAVTVSLAVSGPQNTGGAGIDNLFSIENLIGSAFDDNLTGDGGANALTGLAGNDILDGGAGADSLVGGAGDDTYRVDNAGDVVTEAAGEGTDEVQSSISYTLGASLERLSLTGSAAINGAGNEFDNRLTGNGAANTLDGGGGADNLYGGAGDDTYVVDQQGDLVFEDPGEGTDSVITTVGFYLYDNIENLRLGTGAGNIFGVGNALANTMIGNEGDNLMIGWDGNDLINGGAGNDALFGVNGDDTITGGDGIDYLVGGSGDDVLDGGNQADAIYGEDGADTLWGGTDFSTDILVGGNGDDILHGDSLGGDSLGGDYDLMDGGSGDDTYYVDTPADLTFEAVAGGTDTVIADIHGAGYYLYANVENLILTGLTPYGVGNELDNTLTGSALANWLLGGAGADTLNGKGGNDVLFGEAGADTFVFEAGTGADVIGDFQVGVDKIELDGLYTNFTQVQAHMREVSGTTAIDLPNGDIIVLNGVAMASFTASDFVFKTAAAGEIGGAVAEALISPAPIGEWSTAEMAGGQSGLEMLGDAERPFYPL
jgi:Ca2+-binding RTX toxin-like protein